MASSLYLVLFSLVVSCFCELPPSGFSDRPDEDYPVAVTGKWPVEGPFDAIFQRSNGKIYIFKGDSYYRVSDKYLSDTATADTADDGYPKPIYENWGIKGPIDAVVQRPNGKIYLFKGDIYYRITDKYIDDSLPDDKPDAVDTGYPRYTSDYFVGVVTTGGIDAVIYRPNGYLYFFVNSQYYRLRDKYVYDVTYDAIDPCYPKTIASGFEGTSGITSAFVRVKSNRAIYFFWDASPYKYSRFTDKYLMSGWPDQVDSGYPQVTATKWGGAASCAGRPTITESPRAAFQRANGKIYFFGATQYWRVTDKELTDATDDCVDASTTPYPRSISTNWIGVPDNLDAAFQRVNGKIYFFKGSKYYRLTDKYLDDNVEEDTVDPDYVNGESIAKFGLPTDAVILGAYQRDNGKIYFFTNDGKYYRVTDKYTTEDPEDVDTVDFGYPKDTLENFEGLVSATTIGDVFQRSSSNEYIYTFYNNGQYDRMQDKNLKVGTDCGCNLARKRSKQL